MLYSYSLEMFPQPSNSYEPLENQLATLRSRLSSACLWGSNTTIIAPLILTTHGRYRGFNLRSIDCLQSKQKSKAIVGWYDGCGHKTSGEKGRYSGCFEVLSRRAGACRQQLINWTLVTRDRWFIRRFRRTWVAASTCIPCSRKLMKSNDMVNE